MNFKRKLSYLFKINIFKSIIFNFKVFPLRIAIKMPTLIGWHVKIDGCTRNAIKINSKIVPGMITLGITGSYDLSYYNSCGSYFGIKDSGIMLVGGAVNIAKHFSILISKGTLRIGNNFNVNSGMQMSCCGAGITISNDFMGGCDIVIRDTDGHSIYECNEFNEEMHNRPNTKKIYIGEHVWVCNKCSILKGSVIGDNCVLAYGSLCINELNFKNCLLGGAPARMLNEKIIWIK